MTFFQHTSLFLILTSEGKIIDQIFQFYETVGHDPIIELSLSSPPLCKVESGELRPHFTAMRAKVNCHHISEGSD